MKHSKNYRHKSTKRLIQSEFHFIQKWICAYLLSKSGITVNYILSVRQAFLPSNMLRGQIKPKKPDIRFDSYDKLILSYAKLAQLTNAKSLNIGTEMNFMQNQYQDRWIQLIEKVRQVYDGELLYSINFDTVRGIHSIEFVKLLDYIGVDAYFPLNLPDNASTDMLEKEWERQIQQMEKSLWQHPIIITEAGIIPI